MKNLSFFTKKKRLNVNFMHTKKEQTIIKTFQLLFNVDNTMLITINYSENMQSNVIYELRRRQASFFIELRGRGIERFMGMLK